MSRVLTAELASVLGRLQAQYDVLPFLEQVLPVTDLQIALLPEEMLTQIRNSPDFSSIRPGEQVWLSISAPEDALAELVIYRAEAHGRYYVIAPKVKQIEMTG